MDLGGDTNEVTKNGDEVKTESNAPSAKKTSTRKEPSKDDVDKSGCSSDRKEHDPPNTEKLNELRGQQSQPWHASISGETNRSNQRNVPKVNLAKLGTDSLRRYCRFYNIAGMDNDSSREQMISAVLQHFDSQEPLDEEQVMLNFVDAVRRLKNSGPR